MFTAYLHAILSNGRAHKYSKNHNSSVTALTAVTALLSTYIMLWLYPVARHYGVRGLWRCLREGDPRPLDERNSKQALKSIAATLEDKEKALSEMEDKLNRPSLYMLNGAVLHISHKFMERKVLDRDDLQKRLGLLSRDLYRLEDQIDQVTSTNEIKGMKKELSNRVIKMMKRKDALISVYKAT